MAAYYVNCDRCVERRAFMERTLQEARVPAVRVPAIEPPPAADLKEIITHPDTYANSTMVRAMRAQRNCAQVIMDHPSKRTLTGCVHPGILFLVNNSPIGCPHWSAYGGITRILGNTQFGRITCARYICNTLSKIQALRDINASLAKTRRGFVMTDAEPASPTSTPAGRAPRIDERYVLLMEDDMQLLPSWRERFCRFLRTNPPHTWDLAKGDRRERKKGALPSQVSSLLPDVPFALGMGCLLLRESALPYVLALLEGARLQSGDIIISQAWAEGTLRVAMSAELICASDKHLQTASTLTMRSP